MAKTAGLVLILWLIVCGLAVFVCNIQAQAIVHPMRELVAISPGDEGLQYQTVSLTTKDDYKLAAWYIPSKNRAGIILQHGYPNNRSDMLPHAKMLARHGYGLLMVDLRAQGESQGDTVTFGLYEVNDVEAAYQYLQSRPEVDPARIGSLGDSMGGAVVLLHAAQNPGIKAVVADSAYASFQDVIATGVEELTGLPAFPFAPIIQWLAEREAGFKAADVAPIDYIHLISPRPVYLLHGGDDELIPVENSRRLYEAAGEPRELWIDSALGHGKGSFEVERAVEYERLIVGFFDRYLLSK